jgi:hypothetical protein
MEPMVLHDPAAGNLAKPGKKGDRPIAEVLLQPAIRLEQGLLDDVGGIDPSRHAAIEPDGDHPPEVFAVLFQQLVTRRLIASTRAVDQLLGRLEPVGHDLVPSSKDYH